MRLKLVNISLPVLFVVFLNFFSYPQVSITTDGTPPNAAAMLDVKSTNKGVLFPRIDFNNRPDPAPAGLMIYVIANGPYGNNMFYFYDGTSWNTFSNITFGIGDHYGGGIVFWVDSTFQHGYIAAETDQSSGIHWGCQGTNMGLSDSAHKALGAGASNTAVITGGCQNNPIAASLCHESNMNGYNDWFLPSYYESELMTGNLGPNGVNTGGFSGYYWTSTEFASFPENYAYYYSADGIVGFKPKDTTAVGTASLAKVRCIRSFMCDQKPTSANAGIDHLNLAGTSTTLQGNNPVLGSGQWSILQGTGGSIASPSNPTSLFSGIGGNSYRLRWTISISCAFSFDDVNISFACPTANAGPDQFNVPGTSTTLQGNTPTGGTGLWSIVTGTGGSVTSSSNPTSIFTGLAGNTYTLRWTVTSNCPTVYDDVLISFLCTPQPTSANAGPDQLNVPGVTATLAGNTPASGTGIWNIISGANGIIAQPTNPTSLFTGTNGTSYNLQWTISTSCGASSDIVTISFASFTCGYTFQDTRDAKVYSTVQIGSQCWMKQNVNYVTGSSYCYGSSQPNCDNYGLLYDWSTASSACPSGWHLASDAEWCTLATFLDGTVNCSSPGVSGTDAGGKMKETGTTYWAAPNTGASNSSGFSIRGGGSSLYPVTQRGSFWTSTSSGSDRWSWELLYNDARTTRNSYSQSNHLSVRCLKN